MVLFFKWICAHLLGDFTFQSRKMVEHKRLYKARSGYLYLHVGIHAFLIYLFTGWWTCWPLPLAVGVSHFVIDLWKLYRKDTLFYFLIDQALHILVLVGLWWYFQPPLRDELMSRVRTIVETPSFWLVLSAYIFTIWPCALLLGYLTRRWRDMIPNHSSSMGEAGRWIGIFERLLVLTFILVGHYEGIGFLIAAKSILRFGEIKGADSRAETEYILIGTLMSFSASILTGLVCHYLLVN
ncbi:MAG TPA: DUF3307 domain-containing protein [Dinghuibacter sp.]|jgi:hypothetical protein|uniref:DUF3307 domain-containing protein n=1 Tax=Dinghuibacter sp. TaxID=2024697 RepID=UPI002B61F39D|nr:DUF3307 domain-containing protein [Dinghuibacter sp.]HTJ12948.1 DUF3307 domain-containing protein [Dinghuibacter sp.]